MVTGTIKSAVKLQVMENKWQQRKENINKKKNVREMTQDERMLADFQERMDKERESRSHADIYNKLKSGGKLTSEEIDYLKKNDPEALQKYREAQAEKAAYEKALKNCKTKEEVEQVKLNKMGEFSAQAKEITTNPYIPLDKKVELMNQLNNKLCLVEEAHMDFVKTKLYLDLPPKEKVDENEKSSGHVSDPETEGAAVIEPEEPDSPDADFEKLKVDIQKYVLSAADSEHTIDVSL